MYNETLTSCEDLLDNIQQMILDCAQHTAHNLNGPLARIKGLTQIYFQEANSHEREALVALISENANELGDAIDSFNHLLDDCLCKNKISKYKK